MANNTFKCQRCGKCCCNLLIFNPKFNCIAGLPLFATEVSLFPPELVVSFLAHGHVEGNKFHVDLGLLPQLSVGVCPHYTDNGCAIYDRRPVICQAFPISLEFSSMLTGKVKPQWLPSACRFAANTSPSRAMQHAGVRLAKYWTNLNRYIVAAKKTVYVMDVHYQVTYKATEWCGVGLED